MKARLSARETAVAFLAAIHDPGDFPAQGRLFDED
jgi:hypothetical protein